MKFLLIFILFLLLGFIISKKSFTLLKLPFLKKPIFLFGIEAILIGILLGEKGLGVITSNILEGVQPFLSTALGWIGFYVGVQYDIRRMRQLPHFYFPSAIVQSFVSSIIVFLVLKALTSLINFESYLLDLGLIVISACSAVTSPGLIAILRREKFIKTTPLYKLVLANASYDSITGILIFSIGLSYIHPLNYKKLDLMFLLLLLKLFIGISIAILVHFITFIKLKDDELLLVLIGVISFGSGIATMLYFSPLEIGFIIGFLFANFSHRRVKVMLLLSRAEKIFYVIFLIMIGTYLEIFDFKYILIGLFIALIRIGGKFIGSYISSKTITNMKEFPYPIGLALIPQGGISLTFVISYYQLYRDIFSSIILTVLVSSIIISDLIGPWMTLNFLKRKSQ